MNCSERINIFVSVISISIALIALFQTKRQIALSNKQQLFDRRLSCYLEFNMIYSLYAENKLYLKDEHNFYHKNNLIFLWLTNCADLEEMAKAVFNPLNREGKKILLTKCEQLRNFAIETSLIFDGNSAEIAGNFISSFSDFLKAIYQQQMYISKMNEDAERTKIPLLQENYEKECKEMAKRLGLLELRDKLEYLDNEIKQKKVLEELKNSLPNNLARKPPTLVVRMNGFFS